MIPLPRPLLVAVALGFSAYAVALGGASAMTAPRPERVWAAITCFVVCVVLSVVVGRTRVMPVWLGGLNAGCSLAILLLCAGGTALGPSVPHGHWSVVAAGALLVLTVVRGRPAFAWFGVALLVVHTMALAGVEGVVGDGVLDDVLWVTLAALGTRSLAHAMRDVRQFDRAEREAVEWQAAHDAHHSERQVRLTQTSRVALPMLRHIVQSSGELDDGDRAECRVLEQTIRDEIRGRRLLNEAVREQVSAARRRGAFVQLLDDGGLDDVEPALMEPVLDRVAEAIAGVRSDRIVIRTTPKGSKTAVTVVGISIDETAAALGLEDEGEEVAPA